VLAKTIEKHPEITIMPIVPKMVILFMVISPFNYSITISIIVLFCNFAKGRLVIKKHYDK